ncbi:hypothetical protein [Paenibacillus turpanensis]|uniref:hypothetical protein n=1 Tax=Paenibacillus turpanensis TaxID=2689078 RepID=UPI00140DBBF7|nr:hypothetical protein [Paenibacillus turpanensis]
MQKLLLYVCVLLMLCSAGGAVLFPASASALSCARIPTIEEAFENYDGVVVGTVEKVNRKKEWNELTISVRKSYKGVEKQNIVATEDMTWGALNGPSVKGTQYLFFLRKVDDRWQNPLCSPSKELSIQQDVPEFLHGKEELVLKPPVELTVSSNTQGALIYGIAGGVGGLALFGGILFWVLKSRRDKRSR